MSRIDIFINEFQNLCVINDAQKPLIILGAIEYVIQKFNAEIVLGVGDVELLKENTDSSRHMFLQMSKEYKLEAITEAIEQNIYFILNHLYTNQESQFINNETDQQLFTKLKNIYNTPYEDNTIKIQDLINVFSSLLNKNNIDLNILLIAFPKEKKIFSWIKKNNPMMDTAIKLHLVLQEIYNKIANNNEELTENIKTITDELVHKKLDEILDKIKKHHDENCPHCNPLHADNETNKNLH